MRPCLKLIVYNTFLACFTTEYKMKPHQFKIEKVLPCSQQQAFAFFSEHTNFGQFWPGKFSRVKASSSNNINGLGSVRQIDTGAIKFEETIIGFEENQLIEYTISKNSPFDNYHGKMEFFALNEKECFLRHSMQFNPKVPGLYLVELAGMELIIKRGIKKAAKLLAA